MEPFYAMIKPNGFLGCCRLSGAGLLTFVLIVAFSMSAKAQITFTPYAILGFPSTSGSAPISFAYPIPGGPTVSFDFGGDCVLPQVDGLCGTGSPFQFTEGRVEYGTCGSGPAFDFICVRFSYNSGPDSSHWRNVSIPGYVICFNPPPNGAEWGWQGLYPYAGENEFVFHRSAITSADFGISPTQAAHVGSVATFTISSPPHPGSVYFCALSLSGDPGFYLSNTDYRFVGLTQDGLFAYSLQPGVPEIVGSFGTLDLGGSSAMQIVIPNYPGLAGYTFVAAFAVLISSERSGVECISPSLTTTIAP